VDRRSAEQLATIELVSRWERVRAGTGTLDPRAFWLSALGQLGWYALKALVSRSPARRAVARATWRGIVAIRRRRGTPVAAPAPLVAPAPPTERAA
jgi:hypothetical protein